MYGFGGGAVFSTTVAEFESNDENAAFCKSVSVNVPSINLWASSSWSVPGCMMITVCSPVASLTKVAAFSPSAIDVTGIV